MMTNRIRYNQSSYWGKIVSDEIVPVNKLRKPSRDWSSGENMSSNFWCVWRLGLGNKKKSVKGKTINIIETITKKKKTKKEQQPEKFYGEKYKETDEVRTKQQG